VQPFEFFLPLGADQANISQSLKQLMGQIDRHSSPSVKRLLVVLLSLARGLEMDLPESVKNTAIESLHSRKLLGPITIIGDLEAADRKE
jgi:hypothetical protein